MPVPDLKDAEERLFALVAQLDTWMAYVLHQLALAPNHNLSAMTFRGTMKSSIMPNAFAKCVALQLVEHYPDDAGGLVVLTPLGHDVYKGYQAKVIARL